MEEPTGISYLAAPSKGSQRAERYQKKRDHNARVESEKKRHPAPLDSTIAAVVQQGLLRAARGAMITCTYRPVDSLAATQAQAVETWAMTATAVGDAVPAGAAAVWAEPKGAASGQGRGGTAGGPGATVPRAAATTAR